MKFNRFKGIDRDTNEWIYGGIVEAEDKKYIIKMVSEGMTPGGHCLELEITEVFPETVCQCTGLYDRAGREVYEGDVLMGEVMKDGKLMEKYVKLVSMYDGSFHVAADKYIGNNIRDFLATSPQTKEDAKCLVTGNVHDYDFLSEEKREERRI